MAFSMRPEGDNALVQMRSMKRARDIRDQVLGLMERVEVAVMSDRSNEEGIKKAISSFEDARKVDLQNERLPPSHDEVVRQNEEERAQKPNPPGRVKDPRARQRPCRAAL